MPKFTHGEVDRKGRVVLPTALDLTSSAVRKQVGRNRLVRHFVENRHQDLDALTDQFVGGIAEHCLRSWIGRLDTSDIVEGDDSVDHVIDDGTESVTCFL